jgi:hypothetical protein
MGGRNKICLRNVVENLQGGGNLRHVEEVTQTLLKYWAVDSIYKTHDGKKLKII